MAYNPYSAVNAIYKLKGQWDTANNAGDTNTKNDVASKAQSYYKQLRDNGYSDVADQLSASNSTQAKAINDKWAKMGKTSTRDYLYSLGKSQGMSSSDVDNLIGWDGQTGEVSFGGKKIGTPDVIVDGVSYWSDTSVLDNAFNDYVKRSGTSGNFSNAELITKNNNETINKINQLWGTQTSDREAMAGKYDKLEETAYSNPFETDEAKAILSKYDLAGMQGRNNAVASGGASNGGNIDSYAAANALRQQSALVNQGQMAVLDAHNNKINNVKGILESLGVYQQNQDKGMQDTIILQANEGQRLFENDLAEKVSMAEVTGYVPNEWTIKNDDTYNQFLNPDGSFKKEMESVDIQALINSAKANGDTDTAKKLAVVRARKMLGNYAEYGKYMNEGDVAFMTPQQTEAGRQFDKQDATTQKALETEADVAKSEIASKNSIAAADNSTKLTIAGMDNQNNLDQIMLKYQLEGTKPTLTASQAADAIKDGIINETTVAAYNHYFGGDYTVENPPQIKSGTDDKTSTLSEKEVKEWVDYFNNFVSTKYGSDLVAFEENGKNKYKRKDLDADYIIIEVLSSDDLTDEQKEYLLIDKLGITKHEINTARKDRHYR